MLYVLVDGEPVAVGPTDPRVGERWRALNANEPDPHRVKRDTVRLWDVSTVFLGIDHQFGHGPPVLWETMVFGPPPWGGWQRRYTSRADAETGHAWVIAEIESGDD